MNRLDDLVARHPRVPLALRAAVAAVAAWLVVRPLDGVADDYPYYAPLGAVVSVSTTVLMSMRTGIQTATALGAGAVLALGASLVPLPRPLDIGLVVAIGTVVGASRRFGTMGSWVPIAGLFVLVIGHGDSWQFVLGYLGLTTLGVLVGVVTNTALPPLGFAPAIRAEEHLRAALVTQLEDLAAGLEEDPADDTDDWDGRRYPLDPLARQVQQLVAEAADGPPVNWRVLRRRDRAELIREQGRALVALAFLVDDLVDYVGSWRGPDRQAPLEPELRPAAGEALRALAGALRSVHGSSVGDDELGRAWKASRALADELREQRRLTGQDLFGAGTLVTGIERTLLSVSR